MNSQNAGFTLIELMVVFSVMVILSTIGFASFVTYSHSQAVATNMQELKTTIFTARSRALSQLLDTSCFSNGFTGQGYQLEGYQVVLCCHFGALCLSASCNDASNNYELQAVYDYPDGSGQVTQTCQGKKFTDPGIAINTSATYTTATSLFFSSVTGAVQTNAGNSVAQIGISGYGFTKLATVSATGVIQ